MEKVKILNSLDPDEARFILFVLSSLKSHYNIAWSFVDKICCSKVYQVTFCFLNGPINVDDIEKKS